MITFTIAIVALVLGYVLYGAFVERVMGVDKNRPTPAYTKQDGIDYIPMPLWKVFLIQFLNIAGTGPIFGAISGILFGPAAYLWIVLGCIFAGSVHDYMSGMISLRRNGASLPEIVGDELGSGIRLIMRVFSLFLMIMVGAVFVTTPAGLLAGMIPSDWGFFGTAEFWSVVIFCYYIMATLLPINALIGRIYPVFGLALLIMAIGVFVGIFMHSGNMPEITEAFHTHHPKELPIFPFLFITIACGAISGFHATQSPMMARCLQNERHGRIAFYGAMITEGFVALIWAAAAINYAGGSTNNLADIMASTGKANPAVIVNFICNDWMGRVGAILAILGVVAAPITSGDTALRSARLITADFLHFKQDTIWRRLVVSVPIFVLAGTLMLIDFDVLWRYFGWFNQTLSIFTLWAITAYLYKNGKPYIITMIPAMFMTMVCTSYILVAPEGFAVNYMIGSIISIVVTIGVAIAFLFVFKSRKTLAA
ncbi:MAG: carbon starvation protein A [Bacteroidales bacterium]|jgi:carbon starvation protein CstA|nr:carbon starvation protein A [Bacteroidales bacterium]